MIGNLGETRGTRRINTAAAIVSNNSKGQIPSLTSKEKADHRLNSADKLIPEDCFKHIEQQVHRERREKDEERLWSWFVEQKMQDLRLDSQQQQQQLSRAQTVQELSDLTNLESTTGQTGELVFSPKKNKLAQTSMAVATATATATATVMAMAVDVDVDAIEQKENCESWMERECEEEEEVVEEISSGRVAKEKTVKKCHSDPAMSMRRRGYARQLLRAVHTGKRKVAACCRGGRAKGEERRTSREKYESGGSGSGGSKVGGKSGRKGESENEREMKIGQSVQNTCQRIPLDQPTIQRIDAMRQRILSILDQILYRLCRIPLPDGENDLQRKQRRSMEFAVRFSRNYLYDLNRLVTRLQRNVRAIERLKVRHGQYSRGRYSIINIDLIERELVAAHQLLLHALTAYSNHIPSAALISHTARLTQVLLRQIVELKQVSDQFQLSDRSFASGDTTDVLRLSDQSDHQLRSKCQAILTIFDAQWSINGEAPIATASQASASASASAATPALLLPSDSAINPTTWTRGCCTNRFRMYNRPQLAAAKPSRNQQHRPSAGICRSRGNTREIILKNKSNNKSIPAASAMISKLQRSRREANVPYKKISCTINQTSSATHRSASTDQEPKKAEFATMMTTTLMSTDSERAGSSLTEPCPKPKKKGTLMEPDEKRRGGLLKSSAALTSANASGNSDGSGSGSSSESGSGSGRKNRGDRSPRSYANCGTASHRLSKNGKNTCTRRRRRRLQHSSSSNDPAECDIGASAVIRREQRIVCDASCQANPQSDGAKAAGARNNNLPAANESRTMIILSERTEKCFSEYRWYYRQQCRSRPMYSNSTRNQPWDIVSWISEKLVDELLHKVAKELQITSVIRKMFELEFRDS